MRSVLYFLLLTTLLKAQFATLNATLLNTDRKCHLTHWPDEPGRPELIDVNYLPKDVFEYLNQQLTNKGLTIRNVVCALDFPGIPDVYKVEYAYKIESRNKDKMAVIHKKKSGEFEIYEFDI